MSLRTEIKEDVVTDYKQLLKLLDSNYKYLLGANANSKILNNYKSLLKYLKSRQEHDIKLILKVPKASRQSKPKTELSDDQINNLNLEEIQKLLENKNTPRKIIELVAVKKFDMSYSEVKSISNKQKFVDQLFSIIENLKTHDSIKRMAGKQ